jgi:hypothetical protein
MHQQAMAHGDAFQQFFQHLTCQNTLEIMAKQPLIVTADALLGLQKTRNASTAKPKSCILLMQILLGNQFLLTRFAIMRSTSQ